MKSFKFLLPVCFVFFYGCLSTKPIELTDTKQVSKLTFEPLSQIRNVGGVSITVTPIDAATLNDMMFQASFADGNYTKILFSTERLNSDDNGLSSKEEKLIEQKKELTAQIKSHGERWDLPEDLVSALIYRVYLHEISQTDQGPVSDLEYFKSNFNPFRNGSKYLSTFQLSIENSSPSVKTIKLSDILINFSDEQFYPYSTSYLEKEVSQSKVATQNLHKYNFPDSLRVLPNTKIKKYFSIPALSSKNEQLTVSFLDAGKPVSFNFEAKFKREEVQKKYKLFRIKSDFDDQGVLYYAAKIGERVVIVPKNEIRIDEEYWNSEIILFGAVRSGNKYGIRHKKIPIKDSDFLGILFSGLVKFE